MHPIADKLEIVPCAKADYADLATFCHLSQALGPTKLLYAIRPLPAYRHQFPRTLAIVVYAAPFPSLKPRTAATNGYFDALWEIRPRLKRINKYIITLARGVTHSSYRRLGLIYWLLETSLELQPYPIVECLSSVDFKQRHLQRLGFKIYPNPTPDHHRRFLRSLAAAGIHESLLNSPLAVHKRIHCLTGPARDAIDQAIKIFVHRFKPRAHVLYDLNVTTYWIGKLNYPRAYYIRIDAAHKIAPLISPK